MRYYFYVKLMQPPATAGALSNQKLREKCNAPVRYDRDGSVDVRSHDGYSPRRRPPRRAHKARKSVLHLLPDVGRRQGKRIWLLGRLSGDGERERRHDAPGYPSQSRHALKGSPSQRMNRSLQVRGMRWSFLGQPHLTSRLASGLRLQTEHECAAGYPFDGSALGITGHLYLRS